MKPVSAEIYYVYEKMKRKKSRSKMAGSEYVFVVGVEEFESSASCSRSRRATRLRYTPNKFL